MKRRELNIVHSDSVLTNSDGQYSRRTLRAHNSKASRNPWRRYHQENSRRGQATKMLLGSVIRSVIDTLKSSQRCRNCTYRKTFVFPHRQSQLLSTNASCLAHIGYFVPLTKIADFLRAGVEVRPTISFHIHVMVIYITLSHP